LLSALARPACTGALSRKEENKKDQREIKNKKNKEKGKKEKKKGG
jgi:hypothetical protein